jgi:predicted flavoprotein YhiN
MAVCLQYQSVYVKREAAVVSLRVQIVAAVALLVVLGARVWVKLEATDLGYQLARERSRTIELDMERRELELQRSVLLRPDSLSASARKMSHLEEHMAERSFRISY